MSLRVEPYYPRFGCLAMILPTLDGAPWVVVAPNGRILSKHGDDVAGARAKALWHNTTATAEEQREWASRSL